MTGPGASGLSAANSLRHAGYEQVPPLSWSRMSAAEAARSGSATHREPAGLFPLAVPCLVWQIPVPYLWDICVRQRHFSDLGLSGLPGELSEPFAGFAREHGMNLPPRAFSTLFTAFGTDGSTRPPPLAS